jgi:PAS domain S-box-containing protein
MLETTTKTAGNLQKASKFSLQKQLRHLLEKNRMSAAELSRKSGVSKQSISDWLRGVQPNSIPHLKRIADTLSITLDELLYGELSASKALESGISDRIAQANETLLVWGFDGFAKVCSPRLAQILGWGVEDFCARPLVEFIHPSDRCRTRAWLLSAPDQGSPLHSIDNRIIAKDGSVRWLRWSSIVAARDQLVYSLIQDVTGLYPAENDVTIPFAVFPLIENAIHAARMSFLGDGISFKIESEATELVTTAPYAQFSSLVYGVVNQVLFEALSQRSDSAKSVAIRLADFDDRTVISVASSAPPFRNHYLSPKLGPLAHWASATGVELGVDDGSGYKLVLDKSKRRNS